MAMTGQRFVYYATWCITDGQIIASGLGYAGKDVKTGEEKFIWCKNLFDDKFSLAYNSHFKLCYLKQLKLNLWLVLFTLTIDSHTTKLNFRFPVVLSTRDRMLMFISLGTFRFSRRHLLVPFEPTLLPLSLNWITFLAVIDICECSFANFVFCI